MSHTVVRLAIGIFLLIVAILNFTIWHEYISGTVFAVCGALFLVVGIIQLANSKNGRSTRP